MIDDERQADPGTVSLMGEARLRDQEQETAITQPAIFAVQVALAELWKSWGVVPDAAVGHSVGEVAAAHVAGVLSLEDAVRVIYHRGRTMDLAAGGRMIAVALPLAEAQQLVAPFGERVSIAAINSPTSLTISGEGAALEEIAAALEPVQFDTIYGHYFDRVIPTGGKRILERSVKRYVAAISGAYDHE